MIEAGQYRQRVTIQSKTTVTNELGETSDSWSDFLVNIAAQVYDLRGNELVAAQQVHNEVFTNIKIRYRSTILPSMRVVFRGLNYNILAVIDRDKRNIELELYCSQGLSDG